MMICWKHLQYPILTFFDSLCSKKISQDIPLKEIDRNAMEDLSMLILENKSILDLGNLAPNHTWPQSEPIFRR